MNGLMIAVDGGGTKTDLVLFEECGRVRRRVFAPGCNPNDFGWSRAEKVLGASLDALTACYGGRGAEWDAVFAGISGGTVGGNRERMRGVLRGLLPNARALVSDSDAVSALSSGIGLRDGCVVISGTGSVGFSRVRGEMRRVGGWGYLFDRGGSGYDFGRDAVTAALCAADGRGGATLLTELLEHRLGAPVQDAVPVLYEKGKPAIAALAPIVFCAAEQGDEAAQRILSDNARSLAGLFNALARAVPGDECETVLAGSVFRDWETLSPLTVPLLEKKHRFVFPQLPPVYGSAVEATAAAGFDADGAFRDAFAESLRRCPVITI